MNRICATILMALITLNANATLPYYEKLNMAELSEQAESIVLAELISGSYDRKIDGYIATLSTIFTIKGVSTKNFKVTHKHGWNRLDKLGGYYLIYLDANAQLIKTGSAIIPIVGHGGPFSDASLEEAAVFYKIPDLTWFTLANRLWSLENCLDFETPTCEREKELIEITFNKQRQQRPSGWTR